MDAKTAPAPFALGPENPIGQPPVPIDWTKPLRTKSGKNPVRIYAIDYDLIMPVVGKALGTAEALTWDLSGHFMAGRTSSLDLENYEPEAQDKTGEAPHG